MSVTIKTVGRDRIHVKETTTNQWWVIPFCVEMFIIGAMGLFVWICAMNAKSYNVTSTLCGIIGFAIVILSMLIYIGIFEKFTTDLAYYVDTSMYGIGGNTIIKVAPAQDRVAICKASHEFELEMRERIEREEKLKTLVAECK